MKFPWASEIMFQRKRKLCAIPTAFKHVLNVSDIHSNGPNQSFYLEKETVKKGPSISLNDLLDLFDFTSLQRFKVSLLIYYFLYMLTISLEFIYYHYLCFIFKLFVLYYLEKAFYLIMYIKLKKISYFSYFN